ncbi:MAG: NAD(P)/FAD-dependent oxidoreductase [Pseudomonadota bacterium]
MTVMERTIGLKALEAQVRADLQKIAWPNTSWVEPRYGPDGRLLHNVLIVGGGQGGLALAFQLMRERVDGVRILDRAPTGRAGPWRNTARMLTLRSPKFTTGPDLDVPSLTFQSWYEATRGPAAWEALGKIPKEDWQDYLNWYQSVLKIDVEADTTVTRITPHDTHVDVDAIGPDGPFTTRTRHVVLATGIEGSGRWWMPPFLADLPATLVAQAADPIDFTKLSGKTVAVLGAGASAFDNAATALEAGAKAVHIFVRRPELQRVQPYKQISYTGFLRHMADLDDENRWEMLTHLLDMREAFPAETWQRVTRHDNAVIHTGRAWTGASLTDDGTLKLDTTQGPFIADFAIAGTGLDVDLAARPELSPFAEDVALWADRYAPSASNPRLARYPYLGDTFEVLPKSSAQARTTALSRVRIFTFAATMSFGPSGSSINALKFAAPRLVSGMTRQMFREDAAEHLNQLKAYDVPEF